MSLLMNQIVLNATRMAEEPPLVLPAKTIRFQFSNEGYTPRTYTSTSGSTAGTSMKGTWTRVSTSPNVWDWYYNNSNWAGSSSSKGLFQLNYTLHHTYFSILGANLSGVTTIRFIFAPTSYSGSYISGTFNCDGLTSVSNITNSSSVTNMGYMFYKCSALSSVQTFDTSGATVLNSLFYGCTSLDSVPMLNTGIATNVSHMFRECSSLKNVPLINTSSATDMNNMCRDCTSLESIPLFNTTRATNMSYMFYNCKKVSTGALALYQQASSQATPPSNYTYCFKDCGSNTITGAAELAQIPATWK